MKKIIIVLALLFSVAINGQEKRIVEEIKSEFYEISIGDIFEFEDYEIKFLDILSDSRCPKAVLCVRAGEAIAKVEIYKLGKLISENTLTFTPTMVLPHQKGNLFNSERIKVTGIELWPYPVAENQTLKENYKLKLLLEEIIP